MTVRDYFRHVCDTLTKALGSHEEGEAAARVVFEDIAGYNRTKLFADGDRDITEFMQGRIGAVVDRIVGGDPVQYAVGSALFMGNFYEVTPAVLIPRPETAWLVDRITDDFGSRSDLRILDIGTGSGCIAISLARALHFPRIEAIDISDAALAVARHNAEILKVNVSFVKEDILHAAAPVNPLYDVIVSNPPYICESEKESMDKRVTDHEPSTALFVPDSDPLLFYRAIASYAWKALVPGGGLYLEINSRFPDEMKELLVAEGFERVTVLRDFRGNWRYAIGFRPEER